MESIERNTQPLRLAFVERWPMRLGITIAWVTYDMSSPRFGDNHAAMFELIDKGREATVSRSQHGPAIRDPDEEGCI